MIQHQSLVARVVGDLVPAGTTSGYTDTNADCAQDIQTGPHRAS